MNTSEFTTELTKLVNRALNEGVFKGKLTTAELIGIMEITKTGTLETIKGVLAAQAARQQPIIHLPINGRNLPPPAT